MSDNIYKFPKSNELDLEVELEEMQAHMEKTDAVYTMLQMHVEGIVNSSDVNWEHIMDAALNIGINAGLMAGIPIDELQDVLATCAIEEREYDA